MPRSCADIFADIPCTFIGDASVEVAGIAYSSRDVRPGDAFFCIVGTVVDGHEFAQAAIDAGARVIVCERQLFSIDLKGATEVIVADSRRAMAEAAAAFYGDPSADMDIIGVTGTNGKTTVTYLIEHIMNACERPCGIIGTCGSRAAGRPIPSLHTTPESADLQRILGLMRDERCQAVAMEASSHALALGRVWGTHFAVTAFTNITQDHLDYHKTFDEYFSAKKLLFSDAFPAVRVISVFSQGGRELANACRKAGDAVITVGSEEDCAIRALSVECEGLKTAMRVRIDEAALAQAAGAAKAATAHGSDASVTDACAACDGTIDGRELMIEHELLGDYNTENVLVAFGCALAVGADPAQAAASLSTAVAPPGRMQKADVAPDLGFSAYVDYAHTPDALEKVLTSAKRAATGRVIVVFGCEGDRDRGKRREMARASLIADKVFLTNDNAHSERVLDVIAQVERAIPEEAREGADAQVQVVADRKEAIRGAVEEARAGDVVIICGRGHEDKMMFGRDTVLFDDLEEARYALLMCAAKRQEEIR